MTRNTLTDTQRLVLEQAADQADGRINWFPDHVKGGARMPHDTVKGRRFPLVLRSLHSKHADAAPPRRQTDALSFFHCR